MASAGFNTGNLTFRQLIGNGLLYAVPPFQRDYSWTQDQWDDLWQDIEMAVKPGAETDHYMGYLVLQTDDNKNFNVIDGQQRMTTLSLLVLAVLRVMNKLVESGNDPEQNKRRLEQLRQTYVGYLDPVTLNAQPKLKLNKSNNAYYEYYIVPMLELPKFGLRSSDALLRKASEWLTSKIEENIEINHSGEALARFLDILSDRLFFTVITVADELNAFTVFETLNARGVRLSPTDLLKNYLFSVVNKTPTHSNEMEALERRWDEILGKIGSANFSDFLRVHWNSRNSFVRESGLFKTIRDKIKDRKAVFDLIRDMDEDAATFAALGEPGSNQWTIDQQRWLGELRQFGIRQPWPLLLSAYRKFNEDDFTKLCKYCSIISFRYNVICSRATGDQERTYNKLARDVSSGTISQLAKLVNAFQPIYPRDNEFEAAFSTKTLKTTANRNKGIVKYILAMLNSKSGEPLEPGSPKISLEHIWPENTSDSWPSTGDQNKDDVVYRFGNMVLIEVELNKLAGNNAFVAKRKIYLESKIVQAHEIADNNEEWNLGRINLRQRTMAKMARNVWCIEQLQ